MANSGKIAISIGLTVLLLTIVVIFMGGGHGTYLPAKIIYPYTMILAIIEEQINTFSTIMAMVQIPLYAYLYFKKKRSFYFAIAMHIIASIIAVMMVSSAF